MEGYELHPPFFLQIFEAVRQLFALPLPTFIDDLHGHLDRIICLAGARRSTENAVEPCGFLFGCFIVRHLSPLGKVAQRIPLFYKTCDVFQQVAVVDLIESGNQIPPLVSPHIYPLIVLRVLAE